MFIIEHSESVEFWHHWWRRGTVPAQGPAAATIAGKTPLAAASQQYFLNLEARGADPKTIRTYRTSVDPCIEDCQLNPASPQVAQYYALTERPLFPGKEILGQFLTVTA